MSEPLSDVAFEAMGPAIVSLGSFIELDDVSLLVALHDDARLHRGRVRDLETENARLRAALEWYATECAMPDTAIEALAGRHSPVGPRPPWA